MDYQHPLLFGSFLTPTARAPQQVVALAQLCERAGLDLVTVQDHPYQPAFLDTWTLLSYVAAATTTVRLAPNVANLPLRQPAVLARSVASLDLLSGGRVELGLGAGAFWDAIAAMGGRRLRPGESLQAVREALEVIRGVWDADERAVLRVDGAVHRVDGAKRGPAPAHPIEIWLGAYRPRMLALTGERADGWLPTMGYLQPGDLAAGNARIDEAATAAGRPPESIRRLLNIAGSFSAAGPGLLQGPPAVWAEQLAELALRDGVSGFVLGSDEPADLQRFAQEVAPQVRAYVDAERARPDQSAAAENAADRPAVAVPTDQPEESAGVPLDALGLTPTPDDGTRLGDAMPWDEATRPHRTPPEQPVRYTDQGRAVGAHLIEVHDHLRGELRQLRDLLEQVRAGALSAGAARSVINAMTMRQNDWTLGAYCAAYCRIVTAHHSLEDASVFPHLRAADAGLAPVLDRLASEHEVIHAVLDDVDRALVAMVDEPGDLSGVQRAVDLLTDTLLSHLSYEERELVEPLARVGFYPGQV